MFAALDNVNTQQQSVTDVQGHVAVATINSNTATANFAKADANYNQTILDNNNAQQGLVVAQNQLDASNNNLNLSQLEQTNAINAVQAAQTSVNDAQDAFNNAT